METGTQKPVGSSSKFQPLKGRKLLIGTRFVEECFHFKKRIGQKRHRVLRIT